MKQDQEQEQKHDDLTSAGGPRPWRASRRVILKAGAALAVLAAGGAMPAVVARSRAQGAGETRARRWVEADELGEFSAAEADRERVVEAEFPFYAVGAHWPGAVGSWPVVELSFSADGVSYDAPVLAGAWLEDIGRPTRDDRIFTTLAFANAARFIRYRLLDGSGNPVVIPGFAITYIDASAGPGLEDVFSPAALPTLQKPPIISRAGWGANESYRSDQWGEIWPREYQKVEKVIVHHTATPNGQDPVLTMRSVYYYHAVELEWGDIGYNFLVDIYGNIYEGRAGGEHVVGGHSFQYARGSSGIGTLGSFSLVDVTEDCQAALVAIIAWVGRNLNPLGKATFHEAPNLPTISGHRNVNQSECPGNYLYADLPAIRQAVADVLASTDSPPDGQVPPLPNTEFTTGDNVVTSQSVNLRTGPSFSASVIRTLSGGTLAAILGLPRRNEDHDWYPVRVGQDIGNVSGQYLNPAPAGNPPAPKFNVGDIVRTTVSSLPLRRGPGTPQGTIGTLPMGTQLQISVDSVAATGIRWYGVYHATYAGGWVAQDYLALVSAGPALVSLSSARGTVNATLTVTLARFPRNASVSVQWNGVTKLTVTTDGNGAATARFKIPAATKGFHTVRAVSGAASASAQFELVPRIKVIPGQAAVGEIVNVSLRGYAKKESVRIRWLNGSTWVTLTTVTTSNTGSANVDVAVPGWAVAGPQKVRGDGGIGRAQTNAFIVAAFAAGESEAPAGEGQVRLSPQRGTVNIRVTATLSGFPPSAPAELQWDDEVIGTAVTDSQGAATIEFRAPATPFGDYEVRAVAGEAEGLAPFEVVPRIKLIPGSASRGETVAISLRGYAKKEVVDIRWSQDGGWIDVARMETSNTGSANIDLAVPDWAPDGPAAVRGDSTDRDGGRAQTNAFVVEPEGQPAEDVPTPSPTPEPATATSTATPSPTPTIEPTPEPTETPVPTEEPTATPTPTPTPTPSPEPEDDEQPTGEGG